MSGSINIPVYTSVISGQNIECLYSVGSYFHPDDMAIFSAVSVGIGSCSAFLTHTTFSAVKNLCHFSVCKISEQNNWKHVIHYKFCNVLCV